MRKLLACTALMLCCSKIVLNAQFSISDFLSEQSYTGGDFPVDESLVTYHIESPFDYGDSPFQLRSSEVSSNEENMPNDTPDPGASVPIGDACLFGIIVSTLYILKIFLKKKKRIRQLRDFTFLVFKSKRTVSFLFILTFFPLLSFSGSEYSFSLTATPGAAYLYGDVAGINRISTSFDDLKPEHIRYILGGGIRHKVNKCFSHKAGFAYGHFVADERKNTRLSYRGYAYSTQLCQLWWQPEFTFLNTKNSGMYLFSGIGIAHSSSKLTGSPIRPADKFKRFFFIRVNIFA